MKRLFRRSPKDYGRKLADYWLTWSFGVKPLISDIAELRKAIEVMSNDLSSMDRIPISGSGVTNYTEPAYAGYSVPYMDFAIHDSYVRWNKSVRYNGVVIATPPGIQAVMENFGFTPEDIIPAVWEAVPWSFMIDYFANVGEQLESLRWMSANLGWLKTTARNTRTQVWTSIRPHPVLSLSYDITARGGAAWNSITRVTRQPVLAAPRPPWKFEIPGALSQWINIAALAAGIRASQPIR
jgi:hypothetical protein